MEISVIVPVYNMEKYLRRCMESLLRQSFLQREIILVDDGSTDGSGELCDKYAKLENITVIHQANRGLGPARNRGMEQASGKYVVFADADDYFGPELLKNLYEAVSGEEADLGIGGYTAVYPGGRTQAFCYTAEKLVLEKEAMGKLALNMAGSLPKDRLDSKYGRSVCAKIYRRRVIEEYALCFVSERELISEDLVFNLDYLGYAEKAVVIDDVSYFYCTNPGSLSKRPREDRFQEDCRLYRALEERFSAWCGKTEYQRYLQRFLIIRARFDMMQRVLYLDRCGKKNLVKQTVKEILDCRQLQEALRDYPWKQLPVMQGIFAWGMKRKRSGFLILLIRLKQRFLPGNQNVTL